MQASAVQLTVRGMCCYEQMATFWRLRVESYVMI